MHRAKGDRLVRASVLPVCDNALIPTWERSSSVVECLIRDRGVAGSSLAGVTVLFP